MKKILSLVIVILVNVFFVKNVNVANITVTM